MAKSIAKPEYISLAARLRSHVEAVALVLEYDDGDGMCISDLQEAMYWLRPVIAEVEELEDVPSHSATHPAEAARLPSATDTDTQEGA